MGMTFEEVKEHLKQRFPLIMVDRVLELEPGKRIKTIKNVAGNEIQFLGHFVDYAIMPGTLIIEAIGQSASILFSRTTGKGMNQKEFMALAAVNDMRFLVPVLPGRYDYHGSKYLENDRRSSIGGRSRPRGGHCGYARQAEFCPEGCVKPSSGLTPFWEHPWFLADTRESLWQSREGC